MKTLAVFIATVWWTLISFSSTTLALQINLIPESGTPQEAITGFEKAAKLWEDQFQDDVTLNLNISFKQLEDGVLGSTGSGHHPVSYTEFRTSLIQDRISDDDNAASNSLQSAATFNLLINRTSNSPHGSGSATPFLDNDGDANNRTIHLTTANAKALGLLPAHDPGDDASVGFSTEFNWDFDPTDGVDPNSFNFVYVAAHEIGHSLGFESGVDILDINSPPGNGPFSDEQFVFVNSGDLFRFSSASISHNPSANDWAADTRSKFFSIDGGATALTNFSLGENFGDDGRQASHWKDNLGIGLLDPTSSPGEVHTITDKDKQYYDVIGWDLVSGPLPSLPDLTVAINGPSKAKPGEDISNQIQLIARNVGLAPAPGTQDSENNGYMIDVVLSSDNTLPLQFATFSPNFHEDVLLQGGRVSNTQTLALGGTITYPVGATIQADTPNGEYCLGAVIDPGQKVQESNEENNTACHTIKVTTFDWCQDDPFWKKFPYWCKLFGG